MQIQGRPLRHRRRFLIYWEATFALGWTTCIGPILGALLTLLAAQGLAIVQGAVLAFIYTLGLGLPLILLSSFFRRLDTTGGIWNLLRGPRLHAVRWAASPLHLHTTSAVSGLLLIGLGYLLASGQLTAFTEVAASGDPLAPRPRLGRAPPPTLRPTVAPPRGPPTRLPPAAQRL